MFEEMKKMRDEMDKIVKGFFDESTPLLGHMDARMPAKYEKEYRKPLNYMYETENSVISCFEMPGANKADIKVDIKDNIMEVKVEKKGETEHRNDKGEVHRAFKQQFYVQRMLPSGLEPDKADATYKDGLLKIEIPKVKKETSKVKRLEIK